MRVRGLAVTIVTTILGVFAVQGVGHTQANRDDYSVTIQVPTTQAPRSMQYGYFDLVLQPNQSQELNLNITNNTSHQIVIDVGKGTAGTTDNGSVAYTTNWKADRFTGLKYRLGDAIRLAQTKVTLEPHGSDVVKATVTMPSEPVVGTLAGGLSFVEEDQQHSTGDSNARGMKLDNTFKYDFAVLVQNNLDAVIPNVQVSDITAQSTASQTSFMVKLANTAPTFANTVSVDADITGPNGRHYKRSQSMMQFAPNTQLTWQVWTNGERVPAGDYQADIQVYYGKNPSGKYTDKKGTKYLYHVEEKRSVTVTPAEAKKLAQHDKLAQLKHKLPPLVKAALSVTGLALAGVLWLIFLKPSMVMVEWTDATGRVIKREAVRASRLKHDRITLTDAQTLENPGKHLSVKDNELSLDGRAHTVYIKDASIK